MLKLERRLSPIGRRRLRAAENALLTRNLAGAESVVNDVLAESPDDPKALSLLAAIQAARRAQALRRRVLFIAGALLAVAAGLGVLIARLKKKKQSESAAAPSTEAGPTAPRAILKVVDGVGRGRLVPITTNIFRIGAAEGTREDDRNDLVLSDAKALISRYHCSLFRKDDEFYLIDASLNGTVLNGVPLERGEQRVLDDGDEFVLAGSARVKFLAT